MSMRIYTQSRQRFRVDVDDLGEIPPAGGGLGTVRRERRGAGRATTILIEAGERDFPANNSTALLLGAGRERLTFLHSQSLSTTTTLPLPLLAHGERKPVPRRLLGRKSTRMAERKAVIKNADMSEEMQQDAVDCATQALEKYNIEKDIAAFIKKEFDKKYNPTWHCIVGRNFGSYVTHETRHFIYFYLGQVAILLFKSG
ncbi:Dynein light chain 2, cytoplasmic [Folsomia candida]|uniref:8 kDa dynein light chain n=5 Tax=Hexapoda TaxID=6960 RepID=A0A226E1M5_FOLCA|nr:Dynein light chain 2, cytoplasmic [Folsomia candida]